MKITTLYIAPHTQAPRASQAESVFSGFSVRWFAGPNALTSQTP